MSNAAKILMCYANLSRVYPGKSPDWQLARYHAARIIAGDYYA